MQRTCPDYTDALVDFSDGELPPAERTMIEEHLAECLTCQAELARLDASLLRLKDGILAEPVGVHGRGGMLLRLGWSAAMAAAVLLCVGTALWSGLRRVDHSGMAGVMQSPAVEVGSAQRIGSRDALWQIALFEQQARLQTSLEMLPKDESFDERRRDDERLLAKFQSMARDVQSGHVQ